MATLLLHNDTFVLQSTYSEKDAAKAAGFRWDPDNRVWYKRQVDTLDMQTLRNLLREVNVHESAQGHIRRVVTAESVSAQPVPTPPGVTLSDYQHVGVRWLAGARRGILGDALGLGKTPQAISACDFVGAQRILVVAPKSVVAQWQSEVARFSPDSTTLIFDRKYKFGELAQARFNITNYETAAYRSEELAQQGFDVLICDEAVRLKNRKAKRTQAIDVIARSVEYCWLITGTPIRNRPSELWSLLHILHGRQYEADWATDPVEAGFWQWCKRYLQITDNGFGKDIGDVLPERKADFQREVAKNLIRRDKSILGLPPLSKATVTLDMSIKQKQSYGEAVEGFLRMVDTDPEHIENIPNALATLMRLRQISLHPELCAVGGDSPKTEWIIDYLESYGEDHQIIIFSTFARYCVLLAETLTKEKIKPAILHGGMSQQAREDNKALFLARKANPFIISAEAGSEGLNLQEADIVIWANKPWTPDIVEQGTARAWRRGQQKEVHEVTLIHPGTIDYAIEKVLSGKEAMATEALAIREVAREMLKMLGRVS